MNPECYIYKKEIDWSALHLGFNIPVSLQDIFYNNMKLRLKKGEHKKIKLFVDSAEYLVTLANMSFDEHKYPNHKEILQIRYTENSNIAKKMRSIFYKSYDYLYAQKALLDNKRKQIIVPKNQKEYIVVYSTQLPNVIYIECITSTEMLQARQVFKEYNESELELLMNMTDSASVIKNNGVVKIRKLDKSIGDTLKCVYEFKCQICGMFIGALYDTSVIHAHHIEYFSKSLNNNTDNIMIICPNHHAIIHAANPTFDRKQKVYVYPNGYREGLALNMHL